MWRPLRTEWRRSVITWPAWAATSIVLIGSLLGLHAHTGLGLGSIGGGRPHDRRRAARVPGFGANARAKKRTLLLPRMACMAVGRALTVLLGLLPPLRNPLMSSWCNGIVPFAMKGVPRDRERVEGFIRHDDPSRIGARVVLRVDGQAGGGGAGDARDQGFAAGQRAAHPARLSPRNNRCSIGFPWLVPGGR